MLTVKEVRDYFLEHGLTPNDYNNDETYCNVRIVGDKNKFITPDETCTKINYKDIDTGRIEQLSYPNIIQVDNICKIACKVLVWHDDWIVFYSRQIIEDSEAKIAKATGIPSRYLSGLAADNNS